MSTSEARQRVLDAAESLFAERGYAAVTVKDIAKRAGIHHASLYHHAPGGKQALFIETMEANFNRHRAAMMDALDRGETLQDQLHRVAAWLLSQPPMDMVRIVHVDIPNMRDESAAEHLFNTMYNAALVPLQNAFRTAAERGEIHDTVNIGNIAGAFFSSVQGLHTIPDRYVQVPNSRMKMADEIIDVLLAGLRP